ncbi:Na(+)-translocating NADH-quinone reductase subunit F [Aquimarina sp. W85]|uniref:Na(+)-translocating NADH-quinone reductase subunit F n=1 Tax=Aquimarina rhodophyticola TaxID=3342246 RepID=UPI00366CA4B7
MTRILTEQELHNLAMNIVGKDLEALGYEFVAINSKLGKHPQFVCIDSQNVYYFVLVKAVSYPNNPNVYDMIWMETFKKHAASKSAKVLFAGVGLQNALHPKQPLLLDQDYLLNYSGLQTIENQLN